MLSVHIRRYRVGRSFCGELQYVVLGTEDDNTNEAQREQRAMSATVVLRGLRYGIAVRTFSLRIYSVEESLARRG